jgi:hypothetical protein
MYGNQDFDDYSIGIQQGNKMQGQVKTPALKESSALA